MPAQILPTFQIQFGFFCSYKAIATCTVSNHYLLSYLSSMALIERPIAWLLFGISHLLGHFEPIHS